MNAEVTQKGRTNKWKKTKNKAANSDVNKLSNWANNKRKEYGRL
jgi:hypothetical protein